MSAQDSNDIRFSLVRGGPFRALMRAAHLVRDDGRDTGRQSVALAAITWVPLVALGIVERITTHRWNPLLLDPAVHARLLLTIPLLVVAERVLHWLSARCIACFVRYDFAEQGTPAVQRVVARATHLRDARLPEAALAVAAFATGQVALWGHVNLLDAMSGSGAATSPSAARIWWAFVALPVAQFLLFRSLWRWVIWSILLWGLARLGIRPVALHPDRRGGLAFLGEPVFGFALVVMAVDCFIAGTFGGQMIFQHASLKSFAIPCMEIAFVSLILALGPLFTFSGSLMRARVAAAPQYDKLALDYSRSFHRKWIQSGTNEELLGSADIQSMADLANMYSIVRTMRFVPFGVREPLAILIAAWLPMAPLLLAVVPLSELLRRVAGALLG